MLTVTVLARGKAPRAPETVLAREYLERARGLGQQLGFAGFELAEIDDRRVAAWDLSTSSSGIRIALDERGQALSSVEIAAFLGQIRDDGAGQVTFFIGGADGLPAALRALPVKTWSFGRATWPHLLVRILLAEQLYRGMSILGRHPYHRA